jgi:hypothetical protein
MQRSLARRRLTEHVLQRGGARRRIVFSALKSERRCLALGSWLDHSQLKRLGLAFGQVRAQICGTPSPAHAVRLKATNEIDISYSCVTSLWGSNGDSCKGERAAGRRESVDELSTVGVLMLGSFVAANGGLCGNGDISMISIAGAGEDDGSGGVVIISSLYP